MITIDVKALKDLRERAAQGEFAGLPAACGLEVKKEIDRLKEVESMIGGFERRLERAAMRNAEYCRLVKLETVDAGGPEAEPTQRHHLGSPAYEKLWDHIKSEGLEPVFYKEQFKATSAAALQTNYWLAVKMP